MAAQIAAGEVPCPDPSAHQHGNKLSEQASSAALYVTDPARSANTRENPIGPDGKLSSRGAAASLKYANPRDLPSFPIVGLNNAGNANTAANLASANHTSPSYWKPDGHSSAAGKAAMLAKDYKMAPLWHPELSAAGSKAALLAHKDGGKVDLWMPEATKEGNSAAGIAMRNKTLSPQLDYGYTADGRSRALLAASMSIKEGRRRAGSTPTAPAPAYPDSQNSAHNALNAATVSHRGSVRQTDSNRIDSDAMQAARFQNNHMSREMFSEHPPVQLEIDEKNHNTALRAAAVGMAKQMYEYQNRTVPPADLTSTIGADAAHKRNPSAGVKPDLKQEALKYIHLQEAAQKLAAERLAKLDSDSEAARYRDYYYEKSLPSRSRLSLRGHGRRRASSEANKEDVDSGDEMTSRRIRHQMSGLNKSLADVDAKKQQRDRASLMAAAEKNVHARMHDIDEKVFLETGKVPPAMMEDWERKARDKAEKNRDDRVDANKGKVHVGGGRYMDQSEIDAIAQSRLQPTFDQINDTAEKKRAHDEEVKLDREEQERQKRNQKQKEREEKDEQKRAKNDEKAAARIEKLEKKHTEKNEKDTRRAREAEEKRIQKGDARKSKEVGQSERTETADAAAAATGAAFVGPVEAPTAEEPETDVLSRDAEDMTDTERPTSQDHTGDDIDALPVSNADEMQRPDLEEPILRVPVDGDNDEVEGSMLRSGDGGDMAHVIAERVTSAPVTDEPVSTPLPTNEETNRTLTQESVETPAAVGTDPAPAPQAARTASTVSVDTPKRDSKGIKGLFSKLKNRRSKPDSKAAESKKVDEGKERSFIGGSALTGASSNEVNKSTPSVAKNATAEPVDAVEPVEPAPAANLTSAASSSSFRRHDASLHDVSSLSSSELGEGDVSRGRTGRFSAITNKDEAKMTDITGKDDGGEKAGKDKESGEEEFEEAKDHFDESLVPPPAFAGQAKSESPVRGTRFQEEF